MAADEAKCNDACCEALTDAIETVDRTPKPYRLGKAHADLHKYDDSVWAYKRALELHPHNQALKSALFDAASSSAAAAALNCNCKDLVKAPTNRRNSSGDDNSNLELPPPGQKFYKSGHPFQIEGCISCYDVFEDEKVAIWRLDMPGIPKEELRVRVEDKGEEEGKVLVVEAAEPEEDKSTSRSYLVEICLPDRVKEEDIKTELKVGVLTVVFPKSY